MLWLFGSECATYRVQECEDLIQWRDIGTLVGPEAQMPVTFDGAARFFRAVAP
jgi:hypothetical protein